MLSPALITLLDQALASLSAWHILEGLSRAPQSRADLGALVAATALDLAEAEEAVAVLVARGLVDEDEGHALSFAPGHAAALHELCARVEADRELRRAVIKQAARREIVDGPAGLDAWVAWAPSPPLPDGWPDGPARCARAPRQSGDPADPAS
jgi:hypothetical protein